MKEVARNCRQFPRPVRFLLAAAAVPVLLVGCATAIALVRGPQSVASSGPVGSTPSATPSPNGAQPSSGTSPVGQVAQGPEAATPAAGAVDTGPPAAALGKDGRIDFAAMVRLTQLYRSMRYDPLPTIHEKWDAYFDELRVVDIEQTRNRFLIATLVAQKRQQILVRGTANAANALSDVAFTRYMDPELGIYVHRGFDMMARRLALSVYPYLRPGYELVIFGHSLGAAEAVILGLLLSRDGWNVRTIYASGQPRVTDAAGCRKLEALPIVRIINEDDVVPLAPPLSFYREDPYRHADSAIVLLDGPYYCVIGGEQADQALQAAFSGNLKFSDLRQDIDVHLIPAYLEREMAKLTAAVQVPFANRREYLAQYRALGVRNAPAP